MILDWHQNYVTIFEIPHLLPSPPAAARRQVALRIHLPLLHRPRHVGVVVRPNPTSDINGPSRSSGGAPAPGIGQLRTEGPFSGEWIEKQRLRKGWKKVVVGGGDDGEFSVDGDGLDGELAGYEGRVAEEESERPVWRRRREGDPFGGDGIEGAESEVVVVAGGE